MKANPLSWNLTPNLYFTSNETEIIDCLADHQEMPVKFEEDRVISFFNATDLFLVLYFSKEDDRGFQMYIIKDFSRNVKDMVLLHQLFDKLITDGLRVNILQKAQFQINHIIYMADTFRAMIHKDMANQVEE
jgi:hypothetical protein